MLLRADDATPNAVWEGAMRFEPLVARGPGTTFEIPQAELPEVSLGQPDVWSLEQLYEPGTVPPMWANILKDDRLLLVRFYCSLRPRKHAMVNAELRVSLTSADIPDPRVIDMYPAEVMQPVQRTTTLTLQPSLKFHEVEAQVGSASFGIQYEKLDPVIVASGLGESTIEWKYRRAPGISLQGSKVMYAVVRAKRTADPQQLCQVNIELSAQIVQGWLVKNQRQLIPVRAHLDLRMDGAAG